MKMTRTLPARAVLAAGALSLVPWSAAAIVPATPAVVAVVQEEVDLGEPSARFDEAFGLITGVRALPDGSLFLSDPLGGMLVRIDAGLSSMERIGSEGQGPGEYRQPDGIWPIGNDRSLLVDLGNARLTVVEADGTLGDGASIVLPVEGASRGPGSMMMAIPGGTDASGNVYFTESPYGPGGARDSIAILRVKPGEGSPEVVARLRAPEMNVNTSGGGNNQSVDVSPIPLGASDTWGVASDGSVYIARSADYTVEYHRAGGAARSGAPVDYEPVRIGMAEKERWDDERARNGGVGISVSMENGRRQVSMSRATGRRSDLNALDFPETMPPFANARIRIDPEGNGWVRRYVDAGETPLYDVFNTLGEHVRSVRFPENRTLIGFGDGAVYVARTDEFDQQFLERYELP